MNTHRNMPVVLRFESDGTVHASCPLLPNCQCQSGSRLLALNTIQRMIKHALSETPLSEETHRYEVVHLAVAHASESVDRLRVRPRKPKPESPLLELA